MYQPRADLQAAERLAGALLDEKHVTSHRGTNHLRHSRALGRPAWILHAVPHFTPIEPLLAFGFRKETPCRMLRTLSK